MIRLNKEKKNIPVLEYTILAAVIILPLLFVFQIKGRDIRLARYVFNGLVNGSLGVEKHIDWERLRGLDMDVGAAYGKFSTEIERAGYRKSFIRYFSKGFKEAGAGLKSFVNWRIYSKDSVKTVVAADYPGRKKTLLLTFPSAGRKKLYSMQWK